MAHSVADDEVLKNAIANFAFENFEIASYKGLLLQRRLLTRYEPLNATLDEEVRMARWVDESLPLLVEKHLELKRAGKKASR